MTALRRGYLDGPFGQLHVTSAGAGGAPLLLLHQSPLSGAMFAPALPFLAEHGIHAVALDTPGYGQSDPPPEPASVAHFAQAAAAALDALGWERAAVLGHHTGAAIAAALAVRDPDRVSRIILNGVPYLSADERAHFATFRFAPIEPRLDGSHLTQVWANRLRATPGWTNLAAMHAHVVTQLANPARCHWAFAAVFAHDVEGDLRAIRAPALILTNSGDDLHTASRRAHALRPDFAFHALDGGTHDIVDEQPQAWADAVARFVLRPAADGEHRCPPTRAS